MNDLMIRARLQFRLHDESKWFADRSVVGAIVDAILATRLAGGITHAGEAIGGLGGLDVGHVHPMAPGSSGLDHPQVRPPIPRQASPHRRPARRPRRRSYIGPMAQP